MGAITIRRIDDELKAQLRRRVAETGRSMEAEARHILRRDLARDNAENYPAGMAPRPGESLVSYLIRVSRPGFDIELPERRIEERSSPFE
ncbi:MAG: plasmid stabilization protein [Pseudomonadota bacterium]